ncbi:hypothetical protein DL93DRAFT_2069241 [Clavulina sp. PMI_390]|nr:hypothetical protein DL93DRAFT_2069241 [Clavulina sp. PMI_390]
MFCPSYSILPAISLDGILHIQIVKGSFDGPTFCSFVERLLRCMNPFPGRNSVLVVDNCSIHHVEAVSALCEAR